jgi:ATP-dependent DNA helicase RecG
MTVDEVKYLRESEHKVEFKEAAKQYAYNSSRRSVLGYVTALANEGGGMLILGVRENRALPHSIIGSAAWQGQEGKLEEDIYRDLRIRVRMEVLEYGGKRVLIIHVPRRPIAKLLKFQDVPLMRVGEDLVLMSDDRVYEILSEQEPDYSAKICLGLSMGDLDSVAINQMKEAYASKQRNPSFASLSTEQVLTDLKLLESGRLNYAALLLLGQRAAIDKLLPHAKIIWEFRYAEGQITSDFREVVYDPLFIGIDRIWELINRQNANVPITSTAYIFPVLAFNESVIREAVLNAIAHRDYAIGSEVVIKQYPKKIIIMNPGGFPKGVTVDNLLSVSSTPRSRLMAEVLEKTGLVERSGQGVDKIFSLTLSEGKPEPDYRDSNLYQVALKLDGNIIDKAFYSFIGIKQRQRDPLHQLGVEEIIALYKVKQGLFAQVRDEVLKTLDRQGLIAKAGGGSQRYVLSDPYPTLADQEQRIGNRYVVAEVDQFLMAIQAKSLRIGELETFLVGSLNRNQIKYLVNKLFEDNLIAVDGVSRGTRYSLKGTFSKMPGDVLVQAVINHLRSIHE